MRQLALRVFLQLYPFLHMLSEGLSFSYQLAYLLQASPYFSPSLHLLGQHVVRASGQQLVRHAFASGTCLPPPPLPDSAGDQCMLPCPFLLMPRVVSMLHSRVLSML